MRRGHSRDQDLGEGSAKNLERMPPRSAMSDARVESIRNEMKESSRLRPPLGSKQTFSHSTCWPRTQTQSKHAQTSNRPGWSRRDACINVCVFVSLCACVYVCAVKQKNSPRRLLYSTLRSACESSDVPSMDTGSGTAHDTNCEAAERGKDRNHLGGRGFCRITLDDFHARTLPLLHSLATHYR